MRFSTTCFTLLAVVWVALPAAVAQSDDPNSADVANPVQSLEPIPQDERDKAFLALSEGEDPAFEKFVSARAIESGYRWMDTGGLADCALQLAHGESVLLRKHRSGLAPQRLLEYAGKAASAQADKAALERLEAVAKKLGLTELADGFATAGKTVYPARASGSGLRRYGRIQYAVVNAKDYQQLRKHKAFAKLLVFSAEGKVAPRQGVSLYYNKAIKQILAFALGSSAPPAYVNYKESTDLRFFENGGWTYNWCSCEGGWVDAGTQYDPIDSDGDRCRFVQHPDGVQCGGTCNGQCKNGNMTYYGSGESFVHPAQ